MKLIFLIFLIIFSNLVYAQENITLICSDFDSDGFDNCSNGQFGDDEKTLDCNDNNVLINPGMNEVCGDSTDQNCDGEDSQCSLTKIFLESNVAFEPSIILSLNSTNSNNLSRLDIFLSYNKKEVVFTEVINHDANIRTTINNDSIFITMVNPIFGDKKLVDLNFLVNQSLEGNIFVNISGTLNNGSLNGEFYGGQIFANFSSSNQCSNEELNGRDDDCDNIVDEGFIKNTNFYNFESQCLINNCSISCSNNFCNASGVFKIILKDNSNIDSNRIVEFEWDSDSLLDFSKLLVNRSKYNDKNFILISGFSSFIRTGSKKTVYLEKINNFNGVCIKDSEISNFSLVSNGCNLSDEFSILCDGVNRNGYSCLLNGSFYKISGLSKSFVIEFNLASSNSNNNNNDGGSSGGGGGSSSGGGSSRSSGSSSNQNEKCLTFWKCGEWGECVDNYQSRSCQKFLGECEAGEKPDERRECLFSLGDLFYNKNGSDLGADGITGGVIFGDTVTKRIVGGIVFFVILFFLLFLLIKIVSYFRKKS